MRTFWLLLYNIVIIPLLLIAFKILGLFNAKTRKGINGRKNLVSDLQKRISALGEPKQIVWIHSSSLGEFEQAKPIIEMIRDQFDLKILVTFFSPSGYENAKKYPFANIVSYLPFDSYPQAKQFVSICNPLLAIVMRYDLWPNHIFRLEQNQTPVILVDATLRSNSARFLPLVQSFHFHLYSALTKILSISDDDTINFQRLVRSSKNIIAVGDTRFDRVMKKSIDAKQQQLMRQEILTNKIVFIAGSTWEEDEEILLPVITKLFSFQKNCITILVPHEPTIMHLEKTEEELTAGNISYIRFSHLNHYNNEQVILVDSIGILLHLYSYAHIAFVGGSFKSNIHNVLEAAVYGIPVIYGPKIQGSQEARKLADAGGGIIIRDKYECYRTLRRLMTSDEERTDRGNASRQFIESNTGATHRIIEHLLPYLEPYKKAASQEHSGQ